MTAQNVETYTLPNWEGDPVQVVSLSDACGILDAWRNADRHHRNYGFTSTEATEEQPEHVIVFWVDQGELHTYYVEPFGNNERDFNAYAVESLNLIPGIELEADA